VVVKIHFMENISIKISSQQLKMQKCIDFVSDEACGGISVFIGTVRDSTNQKKVTLLSFSSYEPMAIKEMNKIAKKALADFDILKIAIHHAIGDLQIGEIPVIIAVSSAHREAAIKACEFAINTLKQTVPIWKKEHFIGGEVWINAHP